MSERNNRTGNQHTGNAGGQPREETANGNATGGVPPHEQQASADGHGPGQRDGQHTGDAQANHGHENAGRTVATDDTYQTTGQWTSPPDHTDLDFKTREVPPTMAVSLQERYGIKEETVKAANGRGGIDAVEE